MIFYSKTTGGFYPEDKRALYEEKGTFPVDAVAITEEYREQLISGEAEGLLIVANEAGYPLLSDRPPLTPEQVAATYAAAVQSHMDSAAVAAGYDDIKTAVTYADEPAVARFQTEGAAFRAWRSLCWDYCYTQLAAVQSATRTQPTVAELIAELPALVLP